MQKNPWLPFVLGILAGVVILIAVQVLRFETHSTHHHANFAVYINGQRDVFDDPTFYEEFVSCNATTEPRPEDRVHMHGSVNDVIHVHDEGVSWGNFFENIGYSAGERHFATRDAVYLSSDQPIVYMLNGQKVEELAARRIKSEDTLLVSIGTSDEAVLKTQFDSIDKQASFYNHEADPAVCGSHNNLSLLDKLKHVLKR